MNTTIVYLSKNTVHFLDMQVAEGTGQVQYADQEIVYCHFFAILRLNPY